MAARKVFVGSLPNGIVDATLRAAFQQYGQIEDVYVKQGCEPGRQWAFVTFASPEQAQFAKESCDRIMTFPGMDRPCDVIFAKNQGMFGQQSNDHGAAAGPAAPSGAVEGPKKIFVGSLPDDITDSQLRTEFSRYGQVVDTFVKQGCESGRQWAFVTFSTSQEAQMAKVSTDRILVMPGSSRACEVTLARNQGQFGQDPMPGQGGMYPQDAMIMGGMGGKMGQPPPPATPAPMHLMSTWKCYQTEAGLPYYHNHLTGETKWERPAELQAAAAMMSVPSAVRYAPY